MRRATNVPRCSFLRSGPIIYPLLFWTGLSHHLNRFEKIPFPGRSQVRSAQPGCLRRISELLEQRGCVEDQPQQLALDKKSDYEVGLGALRLVLRTQSRSNNLGMLGIATGGRFLVDSFRIVECIFILAHLNPG